MDRQELEVEGWLKVVRFRDAAAGLDAIISVHSANLGPGLGGCRIRAYPSMDEGLADVKRLSRGMTYKNALAGIPFGGGKSVVFADPHTEKTPEMMQAFGRAIEALDGFYIGAQDSGCTEDDVREMKKETRWAGGIPDEQGRGGNPAPHTAYGVWRGMKAAAAHQLGTDSLKGVHVCILGIGSVGMKLAGLLHEEGAHLTVADVNEQATAAAADAFGAVVVPPGEAIAAQVDIFAPCALGGSITDESVERLQARIVAGAANNQLAAPHLDKVLAERGVLYAPDYVINAAGVISIGHEMMGDWNRESLYARLDGIADTLTTIFDRARASGAPTGQVADRLAEEIFRGAN